MQGGHEAPPLQVIITSPKSVGVPLVGTLTISNIAPIEISIAIDIDAGRARGTAPTGYRYLAKICRGAPRGYPHHPKHRTDRQCDVPISSVVPDWESLHSRRESSIAIFHRTTYSSIFAALRTFLGRW
jgi:hypothetical protein